MPIKPANARLESAQSQVFRLEDDQGQSSQAKWGNEPQTLGTIGEDDGVYIAPGMISEASDVVVTASGPQGKISRALVSLVPMIRILPASVDLNHEGIQTFTANVQGVSWQIAPQVGSIESTTGIYKAPDSIPDERTVTVFARSDDKTGIAKVNLKTGPPPTWSNVLLGAYLVVVFVAVVSLLILLWPLKPIDASANGKASTSKAVNVQTGAADQSSQAATTAQQQPQDDQVQTAVWTLRRDLDLLLIALLAGAVGTLVHVTRSYVDFVGNRTVRSNWRAWYLLYPFIGGALALIFYLMVRAGFFSPGSSSADVNPYGVASIGALVGMFTKQATDKLGELFNTLFKTEKEAERKDKLDSTQKPG